MPSPGTHPFNLEGQMQLGALQYPRNAITIFLEIMGRDLRLQDQEHAHGGPVLLEQRIHRRLPHGAGPHQQVHLQEHAGGPRPAHLHPPGELSDLDPVGRPCLRLGLRKPDLIRVYHHHKHPERWGDHRNLRHHGRPAGHGPDGLHAPHGHGGQHRGHRNQHRRGSGPLRPGRRSRRRGGQHRGEPVQHHRPKDQPHHGAGGEGQPVEPGHPPPGGGRQVHPRLRGRQAGELQQHRCHEQRDHLRQQCHLSHRGRPPRTLSPRPGSAAGATFCPIGRARSGLGPSARPSTRRRGWPRRCPRRGPARSLPGPADYTIPAASAASRGSSFARTR